MDFSTLAELTLLYSLIHSCCRRCVCEKQRKTGGSVVRVGQEYDGRRWGCQIWQATALWLRDRQSGTPPPPHFSAAYTLTHAHTLHTRSLSAAHTDSSLWPLQLWTCIQLCQSGYGLVTMGACCRHGVKKQIGICDFLSQNSNFCEIVNCEMLKY